MEFTIKFTDGDSEHVGYDIGPNAADRGFRKTAQLYARVAEFLRTAVEAGVPEEELLQLVMDKAEVVYSYEAEDADRR